MDIEKMQKIRKIGSGTFGDVILYADSSSSMKYALKRVYLAINGESLEKTGKSPLNEVKVLQSLDHINIIKYYDSFVWKNKLCILMEYAEEDHTVRSALTQTSSSELGDLLQRVKTVKEARAYIGEEEILFWLAQICLAVKYLWDRKILHRDIKLQNIFLTKSGLIKLGDFGISKRLDHTGELAKTSLGTPYYLSPEISSSSQYDHKSDIWMVGCAIHELCSLNKPFMGDSLNAVIFKIMNEKHSPIPKEHGYSEFLLSLIDKMLEKSPENRPDINAILNESKIKREFMKLAVNFPGYQELLDKVGIFLEPSPLAVCPQLTPCSSRKADEKTGNPGNENKCLKSEKLAQNSIHYLIQKARQTSQSLQLLNKQAGEPECNKAQFKSGEKKAKENNEDEERSIMQTSRIKHQALGNPKKTYHKNIIINTAALEPQYQERNGLRGGSEAKEQKESANFAGNQAEQEEVSAKEVLTDKVQKKNFSFAGAIFNPKAPTSPNRSILFSEFLKQRLGEGKFSKMKQLLENSENPLKILTEQRKIVADILGEENLDCVKIFKFLISSSATPPSGAISFGSLSTKKETPGRPTGRDAFEGGFK